QTILEDPPNCTLSFNGLFPDQQGRLLFDRIQIPHVSYLIDSLGSYFLHLTHSPYSILACIDRSTIDFFKGLGFERLLFSPHAVESSLHEDASAPRKYEATMLASCIDYEEIRRSWNNKYPPLICIDMEEAAELIITDPSLPTYQALTQVLDKQTRMGTGFN